MDELNELAMPHSVEAEQAVLGSMLIDERCVPDVAARLTADDFYMRQNRELYQVLFGMFNRFETIDPVTVLDRMKQAGVYEEERSVAYLRQLMEITPTAANVMASVWETIKERQASGQAFPGISTGLTDLDRKITGLNNSDLIILAARPGMGKTALALNIASEAGKYSGKSVAVFSLEMSREQLGMRMISTECLVDNKALLTGRINGEDQWNRVAMAVAALSQTKIYIDDDATLSVADINAKCRRIKDLGLVVIDYLQLMTSAGGTQRSGDNRQQIVSDMSRSLKLMAKELNVPVMCLSQLSRANESRAQHKPMLSDLRESGAIEQDADIVMFIHRESYYDDDTENPNIAECIIAKNRHGETGSVMLEWRPEYTVFRNLEQRYDDEDY